jgi:hypothetical protein
MALTDQPYIPLYVKDWLTSNKLKMCSIGTHGLMINLMCVMHRENEYGTFLLEQKYKQNEQQILNFATVFAKLLPFTFDEILPHLTELIDKKVVLISGDMLYCKRMVSDAELSTTRSKTGSKGGKKTARKLKDFAKAKVVANTANAIANVISINNSTNEVVIYSRSLPLVSKMDQQLTDANAIDLVEKFGYDQTKDILRRMNNYKKLLNNTSVYDTAYNWLKRAMDDKKEKSGTTGVNLTGQI